MKLLPFEYAARSLGRRPLRSVLGIAGSIVGSRLARRIHQDRLKRWFGYFLVVMGIYILARSLPGALGFQP